MIRPACALACALVLGAADASANPAVDYALECQGCHGADGSGPGRGVPDLRDNVGRFLGVPGGRAYLIRVPGSAQAPLDDAALAEVLNWMIRSFGPAEVARDFRPYRAAEVAAQRDNPLVDVEGARRDLLRAMEAALD